MGIAPLGERLRALVGELVVGENDGASPDLMRARMAAAWHAVGAPVFTAATYASLLVF